MGFAGPHDVIDCSVNLFVAQIDGWIPELYDNETHPPMEAGLGDRWDDSNMAVNCYGEVRHCFFMLRYSPYHPCDVMVARQVLSAISVNIVTSSFHINLYFGYFTSL